MAKINILVHVVSDILQMMKSQIIRACELQILNVPFEKNSISHDGN